MKSKATRPLDDWEKGTLGPILKLYVELNQLKQLYRQGWLRRGIPAQRCESVADHSFAVALLALFVADVHLSDLDRDKVLRLALLHDVGEVYAGDLVPADGVPAAEKHRREAVSVERVLGELAGGEAYLAVWREYEAGVTPEAQFVRQIDRLEMALQAAIYERQGLADLSEFYQSARTDVTLPVLQRLLDELYALRPDVCLGNKEEDPNEHPKH